MPSTGDSLPRLPRVLISPRRSSVLEGARDTALEKKHANNTVGRSIAVGRRAMDLMRG